MASRKQFVLCVRNKGYEASLERRKIYELLSDRDAATLSYTGHKHKTSR